MRFFTTTSGETLSLGALIPQVYEDNLPAIEMYTKMGMRILCKDPLL
jgi:hypothetical protein